jgi:MarR family transcriptional regulator, 2-MHQ and catechol-resistance regulon repressor
MPTHYRSSRTKMRALSAYINIVRAADSLLARAGQQLEPHRLTTSQFGVLEALLHLGTMNQRALAEKLLCGGANITMVVDHLEKRGLVHRQRQPGDRRAIQVHLTPKGRALIKKVFARHARFIASQMSALDPKEQDALRVLCRKVGKGEEVSM